MAVALLARRPEPLTELATSLRSSNPGAVLETFPTDTSPEQLRKTFGEIRNHKSFQGLKLDLAVFSIKNSAKKPFMEETVEGFMETLDDCKFSFFFFSLFFGVCDLRDFISIVLWSR